MDSYHLCFFVSEHFFSKAKKLETSNYVEKSLVKNVLNLKCAHGVHAYLNNCL